MKNTTLIKILQTSAIVGVLTIVTVVSAVGGYTVWQALGLLASLLTVVGLALFDGLITGATIALSTTDKKLGDLIE